MNGVGHLVPTPLNSKLMFQTEITTQILCPGDVSRLCAPAILHSSLRRAASSLSYAANTIMCRRRVNCLHGRWLLYEQVCPRI